MEYKRLKTIVLEYVETGQNRLAIMTKRVRLTPFAMLLELLTKLLELLTKLPNDAAGTSNSVYVVVLGGST